ncbi:MAG: hypothetical protein Q7S96_00325 [bacterium]|nr:hypothetical protein [bacterium]
MFSIALPFSLTQLTRRRRRRGRTSVLQRARGIDVRPWNVLMILALCACTLGYLALVNGNATAGYELQDLEDRALVLQDTTRQLELKTIAMQSEERVRARIVDLGYVEVVSVRYLTQDGSVARR